MIYKDGTIRRWIYRPDKRSFDTLKEIYKYLGGKKAYEDAYDNGKVTIITSAGRNAIMGCYGIL